MIKLRIAILIIVIVTAGSLLIAASLHGPSYVTSALTVDTTAHEFRSETYEGGVLIAGTLVFTSLEDEQVYYREYDFRGVTLERLATVLEIEEYERDAAHIAESVEREDSKARIRGVAAPLQACIDEIDSLTLQGCVALNSQILMDLLILNGDIPSPRTSD